MNWIPGFEGHGAECAFELHLIVFDLDMVIQLPLVAKLLLAFITVVEEGLALCLDIFFPVGNLFPQMSFQVCQVITIGDELATGLAHSITLLPLSLQQFLPYARVVVTLDLLQSMVLATAWVAIQ